MGKRKSKGLLNRHKVSRECLVHSRNYISFQNLYESAICEQHLISSASLTSPTYTINMTKSWSPTTAYERPVIINISTHAIC